MAQAQKKQDATQQRMELADTVLRNKLMSTDVGYNRQQADEMIRLAHKMYATGRAKPQSVVLQPTGIQSTLRVDDLKKARDYLMAVARNPTVAPNDVMMGMKRDSETGRLVAISSYTPPMFGGPQKTPSVRPEERPAPVRTFVYNVTVDNVQYQVELNTPLRAGGVGPLESSRYAQLKNLMSDHPDQVLGVTREGRRVSTETFQGAYNSAYLAMLRQSLEGQQPDERLAIETVRKRAGG